MPLQAVLPSVGFLWIAYMRRERALDELAKGGASGSQEHFMCCAGEWT